MNLEEAINEAARDLPEDCNITITVERGSAWVEVTHGVHFNGIDGADMTLAEQVQEAHRIAKASQPPPGAEKSTATLVLIHYDTELIVEAEPEATMFETILPMIRMVGLDSVMVRSADGILMELPRKNKDLWGFLIKDNARFIIDGVKTCLK